MRDDSRASDLLLQLSVTTYQAYNAWWWQVAVQVGQQRTTACEQGVVQPALRRQSAEPRSRDRHGGRRIPDQPATAP